MKSIQEIQALVGTLGTISPKKKSNEIRVSNCTFADTYKIGKTLERYGFLRINRKTITFRFDELFLANV